MIIPSEFDNNTFNLARQHVDEFIHRVSTLYNIPGNLLLEIGPQEQSTVRRCFDKCIVHTLDRVADYNPDIIGDITKLNEHIDASTYDIVACLEILEHTINPFAAVEELRRITKHDGYILFSAPLNWRIHGPIPDCWRFTEFGWRVLLKDFNIITIDRLETPDRNLFPIKYNILAKCDKTKNVDVHSMTFEPLN